MKHQPTSFEDACKIMGHNPDEVISQEAMKYLTPREVLSRKVDYITCCINGPEYKADHADTSEWKHWPAFNIIKDKKAPFGFRLSFYGCVCGYDFSNLGARLPFETEDGAIYMGETFTELYKELLVAEHGITWILEQAK